MFPSKAFNANITNPMNNICNAMQDNQNDVLSEVSHPLIQHSYQHKEQKQRNETFKIKSELNSNKTKLNKLKRINKKHQYVASGSLNKHPIDLENDLNMANNKHQRYHKLPILTCIELVKNGQKFGKNYDEKSNESLIESEHEESEENATNGTDDECVQDEEAKKPKRNVLFKDYVLIPSQTKYKHLLRTVFEQTRLNNKHNYEILTGYIKIHNWKPIRLENISSTPQSPLNLSKNAKDTHRSTENDYKNNSLNSSLNSNSHLNKNWPRSNESVNSETFSRASSLSASPVYSSSSIESASPMSPKSIVTNELDEKRQDHLTDYASGAIRNDKHRSTRHTNKSTTVYDMLSHVVSFSVLHIKLASKSLKEMGEKFKSYEDEREEEEVEEEQEQTEQQKENHYETSNAETKDNLSTKLPEILLNNQSPNLIMQTLLLQVLQQKQANSNNNESPKSITDLLSSNSNTLTSLYSSQQQLASLLPFLNLPILSQMLNNLNNNSNQSQEATSAALNFNNNSINSSNTKQLTSADFSRKNSSSSLSSFVQNNHSHSNLQKQLHQQQQQAFANILYSNLKNEDILSINTSQNQNNSNVTSTNSTNSNSNSRLLNSTNQLSTLIEASPSPSLSTTSTSSSFNSLHQNQSKSRSTHNNSNNQQQQLSNNQLNLPTNEMVSKYGSNNGLNGNRRQRERTTFDPQEEITRLMQIFEKTHHPTRYQIAAICESLNSLACRKDKKPLEPYNIQYWFKNARAALRRKVKTESKEDSVLESSNHKTNSSKVNNHDENSKCSHYEEDDEEDFDNTMDENDEKNNLDIKAILSQPIQHNQVQNKSSLFSVNENNQANKGGNNKSYQLSHSNSIRSRSSSVNNDLDSLNEDEYNGVKNEDAEESYGSAHNNSNNTSRPSSSYNKYNNSKQVNNNYSNTNGKSKGSASKRNRVFIDPISEVPILEHYFSIETYPDHYLIEKICDNLNKGEYRYKFPKLESRNIQLWFKNHRAKLKRLKSSNITNENDTGNLNANSSMQHNDECNEDYSLNDDELSRNHNNNNNQQDQQEDEDYGNYDDGNYDEEPDDFDDAYDNQNDNKYGNHQQRSLKCESGN